MFLAGRVQMIQDREPDAEGDDPQHPAGVLEAGGVQALHERMAGGDEPGHQQGSDAGAH